MEIRESIQPTVKKTRYLSPFIKLSLFSVLTSFFTLIHLILFSFWKPYTLLFVGKWYKFIHFMSGIIFPPTIFGKFRIPDNMPENRTFVRKGPESDILCAPKQNYTNIWTKTDVPLEKQAYIQNDNFLLWHKFAMAY